MYGDTQDLNMVTNRVGIVNQFMHNAMVNGEQAARTLDELARDALFGAYLGGLTRVRTTLGSPNATISVDDIRGLQYAPKNGVLQAISGSNTLSVTVGSNVYTLQAATADGSNVSTAPNGVSGTLNFTTNVSTSDGTAGNAVTAANSGLILRPNARATTAALTTGDTLTMANLLDAVARLRMNAVPDIAGAYNCYLDPVSIRELFADPDFKQLFQGATATDAVFKTGVVSPMLGMRFISTNEAPLQTIGSLTVHRPIVCGQGALIEGDFAGTAAADVAPSGSVISMVDSVAMVTRAPLDRLQQIIAQSWYWIGGFCVPSDMTTTTATVPTSTSAAFKRAVVIEHI